MRTPAEVRALLRARRRSTKCDPRCRGYDVFDSDKYGLEIEACGECNYNQPGRHLKVDDDECAQLPYARRLLARAIAPMTLDAYDFRRALILIRVWVGERSSHQEIDLLGRVDAIAAEALQE